MEINSTPAVTVKDGRVYVGTKSVGKVRRNTVTEGLGMAGRKWVGTDRAGRKVTGIFNTRQEAAAALAAAWL